MKSASIFLTAALGAVALICVSLPLPAQAEWTANRINGMVTVTDLLGEDGGPKIMSLGSGYYFIEWWHRDVTDDPGKSWYQILDPLGNVLLNPTGNLILSGATWSYGSTIHLVPDGAGGVITVFQDYRLGNEMARIYGQRFDQYGQPLWGATGLPLAEWPGNMTLYDAVANSNGEFLFTWNVQNGASYNDLYTQKISNSGDRLWGLYGIPTGTGPGNQGISQVVPDTSGGALILWEDNRAGGYTYHLYAQHLNENGDPILTPNGIPLYFPGTTTQLGVGGLEGGEPDGENGGVFVYTTGAASNLLRVIRVNGDGETQWVWDNGIYAFHGGADLLKHPEDGTLWVQSEDNRTGSSRSYLYHLDLNGNSLFNPAGIIGGWIMTPTSGGIITFEDLANPFASRVIAKRFNNSGNQIWESIVAVARSESGGGSTLVAINSSTDGNDGAVITMLDDRLVEPYDIVAQRVQWNGRLGNPTGPQPPVLTQKPEMSVLSGNVVSFTLPQAGQVKLELFDLLGRKIATIREEYQSAGTHNATLNNLSLPAGVYFVKLKAGEFSQVQKLILLK